MKKVRMLLLIAIVAICGVTFISGASAAVLKTYTSSLSLGAGKKLTGIQRNYTLSGAHKMSITPNWLETGSTKVRSQLIRVNTDKSTLIGTQTYSFSSTGTAVKKTFSKNSTAGNYYYTFTTKIGTTSYGGITTSSTGVKMTLETAEV